MSKKKYLLLLILLFALSVMAYLSFSAKWERVEQEIGLSEKARVNPLLAATLLLQEKGLTLNKLDDVSQIFQAGKITLPTGYRLIIDEAVFTEIDLFEQAIVKWVKAGGHLIYVLSPRRNILYLDNNQLLTLSGVTIMEAKNPKRRTAVTESPTVNINLALDKYSLELSMPYSHYFTHCEGKLFQTLKQDLTLICEASIANGAITFIPSIHPISNSSLKHVDHGEFLLWLAGEKRGLLYLPSLNTKSWLVLIWDWSWQFIMLSLLCLLLYMWHVAMRIGLPETPSLTIKNLFADHIEAVGNFMITHHHHQKLKMALLKDLEYVMEKRNPTYKQLNIPEQANLISQSTGKSSAKIKQLLTEPLPINDTERLLFIKSFKELRNLLWMN
ncbi:MAG: hypothetical protein V5789_14055 [Colwellia sp.]